MTIDQTIDQWTDSAARFLDKHRDATRLVLTAAVASVATASAIYGVQATQRRWRSNALKREIASGTAQNTTQLVQKDPAMFDETLIEEQLARNIAFLGQEGVDRVRKSFVIVVGAGSVGSWAALMLLRSGVQHIRLIDPKRLTLHNMAWHAAATAKDVGRHKAQALQLRFREIAPFSRVECCTEQLTPLNMESLLAGNPSFVVDTMDHLDAKLALAQYCHEKDIKLITSMSVGAKVDPSRIQISDISDTMGKQARPQG